MARRLMFKGVSATWNPVTGCNHECIYCVTEDTRVLMSDFTWKPIKDISVGDTIVGFDEFNIGYHRYMRRARVLAKIRRSKRRVYLVRAGSFKIKITLDHRVLASRRGSGKEGVKDVWRTVEHVIRYDLAFRVLTEPVEPPLFTFEYMRGYLAGIFRGDGSYGCYSEKRSCFVRLAMSDRNSLSRVASFIEKLGININPVIRRHICTSNRPIYKIEAWNRKAYEEIVKLINMSNPTLDYMKGFLAGMFDSEGSITANRGTVLRISQYDEDVKKLIASFAKTLGFDMVIEDRGVRLRGGIKEVIRFLAVTNPANMERKKKLFGHSIANIGGTTIEISDVEYLGEMDVYDIATDTGTFIADGFLVHNCWARRWAETRLRHTPRYRDGFRPRLNPEELAKTPPGDLVFVVSMGDLFGDWVPREWILAVLDRARRVRGEKTFLFLTKNPARYHEFLEHFPVNSILGATIETNRDDLAARISRAPPPSSRYKAMRDLKWPRKMVSVEPILDFDLPVLAEWLVDIQPELVYIGYDNHGNKLPEPPLEKTMELIDRLREQGITVIEKTVRKAWWETGEHT